MSYSETMRQGRLAAGSRLSNGRIVIEHRENEYGEGWVIALSDDPTAVHPYAVWRVSITNGTDSTYNGEYYEELADAFIDYAARVSLD
jgi:hypothetical protein